jgi:flagellar L-ring protein precursor FlgH
MMFALLKSADAADKKKKEVPPTPLEDFLSKARQASANPGPSGPSLFSASNPNLFLFHDVKARNANDIVTIQIVESSTATNSANTSTQKSGSVSMAAPALVGLEAAKGSLDFSKILQANSQLGFGGTGSTSRTGQLQASLSARVVEVLPNGDLLLEGSKDVTINKERQSLKIRGVVRAVDVSPGNVVMSSAIAHMEVEFDGKGIVTNANSPGWLHWLFTKILPF